VSISWVGLAELGSDYVIVEVLTVRMRIIGNMKYGIFMRFIIFLILVLAFTFLKSERRKNTD
jgi:hypothetical protein